MSKKSEYTFGFFARILCAGVFWKEEMRTPSGKFGLWRLEDVIIAPVQDSVISALRKLALAIAPPS